MVAPTARTNTVKRVRPFSAISTSGMARSIINTVTTPTKRTAALVHEVEYVETRSTTPPKTAPTGTEARTTRRNRRGVTPSDVARSRRVSGAPVRLPPESAVAPANLLDQVSDLAGIRGHSTGGQQLYLRTLRNSPHGFWPFKRDNIRPSRSGRFAGHRHKDPLSISGVHRSKNCSIDEKVSSLPARFSQRALVSGDFPSDERKSCHWRRSTIRASSCGEPHQFDQVADNSFSVIGAQIRTTNSVRTPCTRPDLPAGSRDHLADGFCLLPVAATERSHHLQVARERAK